MTYTGFLKHFAASVFLLQFSPFAHCGALSLVSVSDSVFASVEGISNSVSAVSKSASKVTNLAEGDYRVEDVAELYGADERVRLTLRPVEGSDADKGVYLYVHGREFMRTDLRTGHVVSATKRPYGVAIFKQGAEKPLVLVLSEDMAPQMLPVPVSI